LLGNAVASPASSPTPTALGPDLDLQYTVGLTVFHWLSIVKKISQIYFAKKEKVENSEYKER